MIPGILYNNQISDSDFVDPVAQINFLKINRYIFHLFLKAARSISRSTFPKYFFKSLIFSFSMRFISFVEYFATHICKLHNLELLGINAPSSDPIYSILDSR